MSKKSNSNLRTAKKNKNDEFFTQLSDIEKELKHYKAHFKGKTVYCNCDDYEKSNFVKYFKDNFKTLGLQKLISTHIHLDKTRSELYEYDGVEEKIILLNDDGDFRSDECIELLKESDIVVTNPPFSLFREYVAQIEEYGKKYLIIGNINAITYKEIFPLIKENKMWLGVSITSGDRLFQIPDHIYNKDMVGAKDIFKNNHHYISVVGVRWFTNLLHSKRNEELILVERYSADKYPKYDNYDAINVDKTKDIPMDYEGVMGVPISFLDKYCPEQFEIIGLYGSSRETDIEKGLISGNLTECIDHNGRLKKWNGPTVDKRAKYARILIKKKTKTYL